MSDRTGEASASMIVVKTRRQWASTTAAARWILFLAAAAVAAPPVGAAATKNVTVFGQLVSIAVTPGAARVPTDTSRQFTAIGTYSDQSTQDLTAQVSWSSSNEAVATVSVGPNAPGSALGVASGDAVISASLNGITGAATLQVNGGKTLIGLAVTPRNASVAVGASQNFTATGYYSNQTTQNLTADVTWASSDPAVATVDKPGFAGLAQGLAPGSSAITATISGVTGSSNLTVAAPRTVSVPPNNPLIDYSDYYDLTVTPQAATFSRPLVDSLGFYLVSPGARVRFQTAAPYVVVHLTYSNLLIPSEDWRAELAVLVDGAVYATYNQPLITAGGAAQAVDIPLSFFGSAASRTIEIVLPYCATVAFTGIDIERGSALAAVPPRSPAKFIALGDSITQGFEAEGIANSWPFLLAQAKGWQLLNGGYGARVVVPSDAPLLAPSSQDPIAITYLIGHNDFAQQEPLATFYANYLAYLRALRALHPNTVIYCITPIWTSFTAASYGGTIEVESYRQQIRNALAVLGDPLNVLVEGETLVTNSSAYFLDGVHPNDVGAVQMATALQAFMEHPVLPP